MSAYNKLAHKMASRPASQSFGVPRLGMPRPQRPYLNLMPKTLLKPKTRSMPKGMRGYFS